MFNSTLVDFLSKQTKIRAFFEVMGGFGNQVNTLHILDYIRDLGFQGSIELIYIDEAKGKLEKLLSLEQLPDHAVHLSEQKLTLIPYTQFSQCFSQYEPVEICLNGGQLSSAKGPKAFKADKFLFIPPYGLDNSEIWQYGNTTVNTIKESIPQSVPNKVLSYEEVLQWISCEDKAYKNNLSDLIRQQQAGTILTQSIYGLNYAEAHVNFPRAVTLYKLAAAAYHFLVELPDEQRKPTFLLVHYSLSEIELTQVKNMLEGEWPAELSAYQIPTIIEPKLSCAYEALTLDSYGLHTLLTQTSRPQSINSQLKIILVSAGALPYQIFDYLLTYPSDLLPVQEGLNSQNMLLQQGIPYIHVNYREYTSLKASFAIPMPSELKELYSLASKSLMPSTYTEYRAIQAEASLHLARLYLAAHAEQSKLKEYFKALQELHLRPENNKVLNVFALAANLPSVSHALHLSPTQMQAICEEPPVTEANFGWDEVDCNGSSPLALALIRQEFAKVAQLYEQGARHLVLALNDIPAKWLFIPTEEKTILNTQTYKGVAISHNLPTTVFQLQRLLQKFKQSEQINPNQVELLLAGAVALGDKETAEQLLALDEKLIHMLTPTKWSLAMIAIAAQDKSMLAWLLQKAAVLKEVDYLQIARHGNEEIWQSYPVPSTLNIEIQLTEALKANNDAMAKFFIQQITVAKPISAELFEELVRLKYYRLAQDMLPFVADLPTKPLALYRLIQNNYVPPEPEEFALLVALLDHGANYNYIDVAAQNSIQSGLLFPWKIGLLLQYGANSIHQDHGKPTTLSEQIINYHLDPQKITYFATNKFSYEDIQPNSQCEISNYTKTCQTKLPLATLSPLPNTKPEYIVSTPEPPCHYTDGSTNIIAVEQESNEQALIPKCSLPKSETRSLYQDVVYNFGRTAITSYINVLAAESVAQIVKRYTDNELYADYARSVVYICLLLAEAPTNLFSLALAIVITVLLRNFNVEPSRAAIGGNIAASAVQVASNPSTLFGASLASGLAGSYVGSKAALATTKLAFDHLTAETEPEDEDLEAAFKKTL